MYYISIVVIKFDDKTNEKFKFDGNMKHTC